MKCLIKTGDEVQVICGKESAGRPRTGRGDEAGARGRVKRVLRSEGRVIVAGVRMVKKATRPDPRKGHRGGFIELEAAIQISNVMLVCKKCDRPVRVRAQKGENGKKLRICRRCGETV